MTSRPTPISSRRAAAPALFHSARATRDLPLIAFAVALFLAFAAHAGAFFPRVSETPRGRPAAPVARTAGSTPAPSPSLACEGADGTGTVPHC